MRHLKTYKLFESIDNIESDIKDIKEILNDIVDREDNIWVDVGTENVWFIKHKSGIVVRLHPADWYKSINSTFRINKNIESTIQRLDYLYSGDYNIKYWYEEDRFKHNEFYVSEKGLIDERKKNLIGSNIQPPIDIKFIYIIMEPKNNETSKVSESANIIESIDSDRIDIKEMMNDITDNYDVYYSDFDKEYLYLTRSKSDYEFSLSSEFGAFLKFIIDEYIESIFKRFNYTYSSEYNIKYYIHFFKNKKYQTKEFYVDEDGMFFKEENIFGYDRIGMIGVEPRYIGVEMSKK